MLVKSKFNKTNLFFLAFSLILAYSFIGIESVLGPGLKALTVFSFIIFGYLYLMSVSKFKNIELIRIFFFLFLFFLISHNTKDYSLFKLMLFLLAFRCVDFRLCIKYDVWLRLSLILVIYFLYLIGLLPDVTGARGEATIRHSFGFTNPNALALAVSIFCMEFMYVYNKKHIKTKCVFIFIVMFIATSVTDSRTSLYSVIFFMLLFLVNSYMPKLLQNKLFLRGVQFSPIILSFLIVYMIQEYSNNPFSNTSIMYDELLSGRIDIAAAYYKIFEPTLFGNDLSLNPYIDRSVDNFYVTLFLSSGIIVSIFFFIAYWRLIDKLYKLREMNLIFIFLSFTIMGISEKLWFFVDYNLLMMAFGMLLYSDKSLFSYQVDHLSNKQ